MNKRIEKFNDLSSHHNNEQMVKNIRWLNSYAWLTLLYIYVFCLFLIFVSFFLFCSSAFSMEATIPLTNIVFYFFFHLLFWHIEYRVFLWLLPKAINWFSFSLLLYNTFYTTHIIFTLSLKIDKFNGTWPLIYAFFSSFALYGELWV